LISTIATFIQEALMVWKLSDSIRGFAGRFGTERVEIETRNNYGFGIMRGWRIGNFSRIRHWWIEIGRWTFFLNLGKCEAYNPRAPKEEWPDVVE